MKQIEETTINGRFTAKELNDKRLNMIFKEILNLEEKIDYFIYQTKEKELKEKIKLQEDELNARKSEMILAENRIYNNEERWNKEREFNKEEY